MKSKFVYLSTLFLILSFSKSFALDSLKFVGGLNRLRSLHVTKVHVPIEYTPIEIGKQ